MTKSIFCIGMIDVISTYYNSIIDVFFVFNYTVKSGTFHLLQTPDETALMRKLTGSLLS